MSETVLAKFQRRAASRVGTILRRKYRIDRVLGIGGMATVYAATHRHGHRVAIKVLHDAHSGDDLSFAREARLANTVAHPGVLNIQDDDFTDDGCPFLVMPLLQGETVQERWERHGRRLPLNEVVAIAALLLDVLAAAHEKKVVHRDIKPENLFITIAGELKVLDFGIARPLDAEAHLATRSGRAVGTPAFMAPEQAFGGSREIDQRTDIWGVGATIFALLSGHYVHEAETSGAMVIHAATRPARHLAELCPHIPRVVCEVVDRALSFRPEERWADARAMLNALREVSPIPVGPLLVLDDTAGNPEFPVGIALGRSSEKIARRSVPAGGTPLEIALRHRRSKPTRTSTGVSSFVAPTEPTSLGHLGATPSRRLLLIRVVRGAAVLLGIVVLASAATAWRAHTSPSAAVAAPRPSLEQLSRATNPLALAEFTTGIQQWKDAAADEARAAFERAAIADTTLASAHLRYVMCSGNITATVRDQFGKALNLRAFLSDDERRVLDAFEPAMREPADLAETERRLDELSTAWPDPLLILTLAARRLRLGRPTSAVEAVDRATAIVGPNLGLAAAIRAMAHIRLDNIDAARNDLEACLSAAPHSSACLETLSTLEASEGHCAEVAVVSRRWIAALPESPMPYRFLAGALLVTDDAVDAARDAVEQRWSRIDAPSRPLAEARDRYALDAWRGDFGAAAETVEAWERSASSVSDSHERGRIADSRLQLSLEIGKREAAAHFARTVLERNMAWAVSPVYDPRVSAVHVLRETGLMNDTEFDRLRDSWQAAAGDTYGSPARIWYNFFAVPVGTTQDAERALAELPKYALFDRSARSAACDLTIGNVYYLARRYADALPFFERAEHSCHIDDAMERVQASLQRGRCYEELGDAIKACDAYRRVLVRWGRASNSVTAKAARQRSIALKCPSFPETIRESKGVTSK